MNFCKKAVFFYNRSICKKKKAGFLHKKAVFYTIYFCKKAVFFVFLIFIFILLFFFQKSIGTFSFLKYSRFFNPFFTIESANDQLKLCMETGFHFRYLLNRTSW